MARRDGMGIPTQVCVASMPMFPPLHLLLWLAHEAKRLAPRLMALNQPPTVTLGRVFPN